MTDFYARAKLGMGISPIPGQSRKREFSISMAMALCPSITEYFLRMAERQVQMYSWELDSGDLSNGDKREAIWKYQNSIWDTIPSSIKQHTLAISDGIADDYFPDEERKSKVVQAAGSIRQESQRMDCREAV